MNLLEIIKQGIKAVPATRYALGIVGLVASIALIKQIGNSFWLTVSEILVLLVLMALLMIFAGLAQTTKKESKGVMRFIMWPLAVLFVGACILVLTSIFFEWPQLHSPWNKQNRSVSKVTEDGTSGDTLSHRPREKVGVDIKVISSPGATVINGDSNKVSR
ncbi:MAG TPA: hypothetical protein VK890_04295 [Bacteroidia bacterium]|nr:hypothetical protein [Bacteroidia bacterium]